MWIQCRNVISWLWSSQHVATVLQMDIFDAADRYKTEGRSVVILAGKEYGSGSSRDWAAKGPWMLVGAVALLCHPFEEKGGPSCLSRKLYVAFNFACNFAISWYFFIRLENYFANNNMDTMMPYF